MWRLLLIPAVLFAGPVPHERLPALPSLPSLSLAAEYYYRHHDYIEALRLWNEVALKEPANSTAILRIMELKLMLEGHGAIKTEAVKFLNENRQSLSGNEILEVQSALKSLQEVFISDEGQSNYLQAIPKMEHDDCAGALKHLNQAIGFERGHLQVYKRRAVCEKKLGLAERFYESAKAAYDLCPFDREAREQWVEALIYYKDYDSVQRVFKETADISWSASERLHFGLALLELGNSIEALRVLRGVADSTSPMVWYAMGKIYVNRPGFEKVGLGFWRRFARATQFRFDGAVGSHWDPYRLIEKREEVTKAIAEAFEDTEVL